MARDPYKYFRIEAQELVEELGRGLLELETTGAPSDVVQRLLRHAHTLKGAARVVRRADIGELAHELEEVLAPHRGSGDGVAREHVDRALGLLDQIRGLVDTLSAEASRPAEGVESSPADPGGEHGAQTIRVRTRDVDVVLDGAFEAQVAAAGLAEAVDQIGELHARVRELVAGAPELAELERLDQLLDQRVGQLLSELVELRAAASDLRLIPAQALMSDVERAARDAARPLGKRVEVRGHGTDTRIDAQVLSGLRGALVHIVGNAVAHGIEESSARQRAGKPAAGQIDVFVERRGHRAAIRCRDDGRGLDLESVRRAAVDRGRATAEAARSMDEEALAELLLRGGITTARGVTGVSGRGVGLDAVRQAVHDLGGEVKLESRAGQGTTVEMIVPISLSAMPALALEIDGASVVVALDSVRKTLRVNRDEISRAPEGDRLVIDGDIVPFLPLRRVLHQRSTATARRLSAVVLEADGRLAAVGVDRLGGAREIVVRPVPRHAAARPVVAGATFDDAGLPQLVLGAQALVEEAWLATGSRMDDEAAVSPPPPLLVIDDSLTTRMLEQSILEAAGYEVDLAVSGEEALEKAGRRDYGLFIVDVEMPGMTGFEFIDRARSDPRLRDIPAILVTSRSDDQDKRRGKEVGARAYIVKGELDQAELLETIRRLVG